MNRGHVLQSSPVQQMMAAGSPAGWWSTSNMRAASAAMPSPQPPSQQPMSDPLIPNNSSQFVPTLPPWADHNQEMPESWSQLLLGGLVSEEEHKAGAMEVAKKMASENWEEQVLLQQQRPQTENSSVNGYNLYENAEFHASAVGRSWSQFSQMMPVSSPNSCVTTLSSNLLDFSSNKSPEPGRHPVLPDPSPECNSTGGAAKKARVQPSSSTQSSFKVRKEKLGDRITALHQLVSPFGKTDTASVLLEAIGYVRFLQSQIEALSLPYLATSKSGNNPRHQHHHVQGGERNCLFPEDPGQLLNENCMKRKKAVFDQGSEEEEEVKKDLRSRGLCLVPISCTLQVGSDNGADYWAPALGGGGFQ